METFFLTWRTFWIDKRALFYCLLGLFIGFGFWSVFQLNPVALNSINLLIGGGLIVVPLVIISLIFRDFKLVLFSLIPSILGGLFSFIIYYLAGNKFDLKSYLIFISVTSIVYSNTLYLLSTLNKNKSIESTIRVVIRPIFIASIISIVCFFGFTFSDSAFLVNIGFFGGFQLVGGMIGLILILPVFIKDQLNAKELSSKPLSIETFIIKNRLVRFLLISIVLGVTIWLGFETVNLPIKNILILKNASFLYYSLATVFVILLVAYGRIEYALITFLPIVLTWIWTLGMSSVIGLEISEYHIFIFSLIFGFTIGSTVIMSDSFKLMYSYGNRSLNTSPLSIVLVGITLIFSVSVLLISNDPEVQSLAVFGLIGAVVFLFLSVFVQAYLIQLLIINRANKKKTPITLFGLFVSVFAFSYFFVGCVLLFLLHLIFRIIPFQQKNLKRAFRFVLCKFSWSLLYIMANTKKKRYNFENLDFSEPRIIIANHQSFLDILQMVALNPNIAIMTNEWVYKSPFFGLIIRYAGYLRASNGMEENLEEIQARIADGLSIMIFPEGTRSESGKLRRFHKGAFYLSEVTGLPIQPILIHGNSYTMTKGDYLLKNGYLTLKALPKIELEDVQYGKGYRERTKSISKYFKAEHTAFYQRINDSEFLFDRVIHNYILKNPIMEWYIRIKWRFESKNYDFYNTFLKDDSVVYDLGCGYGYMSYYFAFRGENRKIFGMDYDQEKIDVALNCYDKTENIHFESADIRTYQLNEPADAIFITDVIHYLKEEEQFVVLKKCADALKEGGVLFLRDGISDLQERHETTKLTEVFSTKILGFNKSENDLHFFSKQDVFDFAKSNGLTCEIKEQSQKTSNVLFILKKISS